MSTGPAGRFCAIAGAGGLTNSTFSGMRATKVGEWERERAQYRARSAAAP